MNTSHVRTNSTTGERGESEQGQPWRKVVRGGEMPGESGYGIHRMKTAEIPPRAFLSPNGSKERWE